MQSHMSPSMGWTKNFNSTQSKILLQVQGPTQLWPLTLVRQHTHVHEHFRFWIQLWVWHFSVRSHLIMSSQLLHNPKVNIRCFVRKGKKRYLKNKTAQICGQWVKTNEQIPGSISIIIAVISLDLVTLCPSDVWSLATGWGLTERYFVGQCQLRHVVCEKCWSGPLQY